MSHYADTSFLFSYYASDVNSVRADGWRQQRPFALSFTWLHRLELQCALGQRRFRGTMSADEAALTWANVEDDLASGLLVDALHPVGLFEHASEMAARHVFQIGARSLDVLHVAVAQLTGAQEMVTFDRRQASLAAAVGMRVVLL